MWIKSYSAVTKEVTREQMWRMWADVNHWTTWRKSIDFASIDGKFESGNFYNFQPKDGPKMKIKIYEAIENQSFTDLTTFPLAKMYGKHTFEPTSDGLCVTTTMTVVGILGFLWRKIVAQKIVDDLPGDIESQINAAKNY